MGLNLYEELDSIIKLMVPYALNKGVTLIGQIENFKGHILGNSGLFRQCILNIVKNALEATPSSGKVKVTVTCLKDTISIEIKDTGLGMMETYNGIQHLGGVIDVESMIGQGTKFVITFPLVSYP
jgi:two-component system sporulation sensor kinase B